MTTLAGVFYRDEATWVAAAMTEADREVPRRQAQDHATDLRLRFVSIDPGRSTTATTTGSRTGSCGSPITSCGTSRGARRSTSPPTTPGTRTRRRTVRSPRCSTGPPRTRCSWSRTISSRSCRCICGSCVRTPASSTSPTRRSRGRRTFGCCRSGCASHSSAGWRAPTCSGSSRGPGPRTSSCRRGPSRARRPTSAAGGCRSTAARHWSARSRSSVGAEASPVDRRAARDEARSAERSRSVPRRAAAAPARRPAGAVEEHPARVPRVRAVPPAEPELAGPGALPRPPHAVTRGVDRVPRVRRRLLGGGAPDQHRARRATDGYPSWSGSSTTWTTRWPRTACTTRCSSTRCTTA